MVAANGERRTPPPSPSKKQLTAAGAAAAMVPRIASVGALTASAAALALDVGTPVWVPDTRGAAPGKKPGCGLCPLRGRQQADGWPPPCFTQTAPGQAVRPAGVQLRAARAAEHDL